MSHYLYGANISANGIRQHYLRYGGNEGERANRPAVIIIPGITSPAVTWGFVGERFARQFDTYILDVRGRGLSEASETLDYGLDAQAADVVAFAKALRLSRYILVGHSMGGRIGARAASTAPAGLEALVMVDPPVSGPGRRAYPAKLPGMLIPWPWHARGAMPKRCALSARPGRKNNCSFVRSGCIHAMNAPLSRALTIFRMTTSMPIFRKSRCRSC
ncbi:alpha/beta hydrolase [Advenella kashmirensis WT001]|uniref:Alpha/beta hydrolase n=1 Tax=Advenella kashmirensis (strain DSM 17095 / LMG 22695 / WT001) TaxID=1036672 RepID=I3UFG0_ADVKW|nr:alpha/beta hydrolase [Advenella kashmirensis WT001]